MTTEHDYEPIATITVLRCRRTGKYAAMRDGGAPADADFDTLDALLAVQGSAIVRELRQRPTLELEPVVLPAPEPLPDAVSGERP